MSREFTEQHEALLRESAEATATTQEQVAELRKSLLSLQERDTDADDGKVTDLEQRLVEVEQAREQQERDLDARLDELRLVATGSQPSPNGNDGGKFRGFLADAKVMQERALSWCRSGQVQGEQRAIDTTAIGSAGAMPAETLAAFLDYVVQVSSLLSRINVIRMRANTRNLDRLVVSKQQLKATTEGAALAVNDAVAFAKRTLSTVGVGWNEDVTLEWIEDNIEGAAGEDHLAMAIATQFGNDVVDLALNGDSTTGTFLSILDGFSKLARGDAAVIDRDGTTEADASPSDMFRGMLSSMPAEYRMMPGMAYTVPSVVALNYADEVSARATVLGDQALVNGIAALRYFGLPVHPEALMNSAQAGAETADAAILTPDGNLAVGFQREVSFTAEYVPRKRQVELTLDARLGVQHAFGGVMVFNDNVAAALLAA